MENHELLGFKAEKHGDSMVRMGASVLNSRDVENHIFEPHFSVTVQILGTFSYLEVQVNQSSALRHPSTWQDMGPMLQSPMY